jgi:hypothetical protein
VVIALATRLRAEGLRPNSARIRETSRQAAAASWTSGRLRWNTEPDNVVVV